MSVGRTFGSPCSGHVAIAILDGIQSLLDIFADFCIINHPSVAHTHIDHKQRFSTKVLGQLQHLMESQSIADVIVPIVIPMSGASLYRSDGILPLKAVGLSVCPMSFHITTTGETDKCRIHRFQFLGQINAASVFPVFVSWGKEAYHIQTYVSCNRRCQREPSFCIISRSRQFCCHFLPFTIQGDWYCCLSQRYTCFCLQSGRQCPVVSGIAFSPKVQFVGTSIYSIDTPKSVVAHTIAGREKFQVQCQCLCLIHHPLVGQRHSGSAYFLPIVGIGGIILERTVMNQFRIKSAISRMIDFLEEDAIVTVANRSTAFTGIDVQHYLCMNSQTCTG